MERRFTMPNWCDCTYKCVGDLKEVKAIYKVLKSLDIPSISRRMPLSAINPFIQNSKN